ncbi:MAG TPA: hypothetical protein VFL51_00255 [Pseudolabrys sp.]|nr:hypothetical protein [Pseudolabrys sp.]
MRLSPSRVEKTLSQFEAQVIPESHPSMAQLKGIWGDHTYFLAVNGLNIVEPLDRGSSPRTAGVVVNVANWTDETATRLAAHEPEATEVVVEFDGEGEAGQQAERKH